MARKSIWNPQAILEILNYKMGDLTQEQADAFRDYVNGATVSGNYDTNIMDIVIEESAAYFAGDKNCG